MNTESNEAHAQTLPPNAEQLVQRVLAGPSVSRSPRLSELLAYLCDWTLTHNGTPLTEEQVGVAVFGRRPGYDTTSDTIVRVQVSQLRKKLEQHFRTDGQNETHVIELPKRTYAAVFRSREAAAEAPAVASSRRWVPVVAATAALLLVAACIWLALDNARLRNEIAGDNPGAARFLGAAFGPTRPVMVVVSDGATLALNDYLDQLVTPHQYRSSGFPERILDEHLVATEHRPVLDRVGAMNLTTLQDVQVSSQLAQRLSGAHLATSIVYARDFRFQPQTTENLIFIGHRKGNPWTALFEERLNFAYSWDNVHRKASIVNRKPQPGELAVYPVQFGVETYAVLALMPKPGGEGAVMLIEGGDMGGTLAAAAMVCQDTRVRELAAQLGVRPGAAVPWFEVLIRTKLMGNVVHEAQIVARRVTPR